MKVDRLPSEVHDEICSLRVAHIPWQQIEERSKTFVPWDKLPPDVAKLFPARRIPHSNLHRWYDLRYTQVIDGIAEKAEASRTIAAQFAGKEFEKLPEAVRHALADSVFQLTRLADQGDGSKFRRALVDLGYLVSQFQKNAIAQEKVDVEKQRIALLKKKADKETGEVAAKLGKGKPITLEDINRIRERTFGLPPVERAAARHPA